MSGGYPLLFADDIYAELIQDQYDAAQWMQMDGVLAGSAQIPRSKKKLLELCRKGAVLIGDTLIMRKTGADGVAVSLNATIIAFGQHTSPLMRTIGPGHNTWSCDSPQTFLDHMVHNHPTVKKTSRNTWDSIVVVRNGQELGTLQEVRQCFQLWEDEMEKWGCNGLGEQLDD